MSPAQKSVTSKIARTSLVVALLLGTPIPIVWFGAKEAEKRIAAGDSDGAERMLSVFGALSTYPLLPRVAEARVHGVRCELSARKGLDSDAMDHFVKELSILSPKGLSPKGQVISLKSKGTGHFSEDPPCKTLFTCAFLTAP